MLFYIGIGIAIIGVFLTCYANLYTSFAFWEQRKKRGE